MVLLAGYPYKIETLVTKAAVQFLFYLQIRNKNGGLLIPDHTGDSSGKTDESNEETELIQELRCESRGGRPGLPVPSSLYGLCGSNI